MVFLAAVVFLARRSVDLGGHPLFPAVLPFLVWTGVAFVLSDDWAASFPSLQKTMAPFCLGALAALHGTERTRRSFLFLLGAGGGAEAALAGVRSRGASVPDLFPGNPVYGGFWMAVAGLVFLSFAIEATLSRRARLLSAAAAAGLMSGAVLTRSRSIVLGLLAGTAVVVLHRWGRRGAVGLAAAAALGFALLPTATVRRWSKVDDPYAFDRTLIWRGAVSGLLERPVVGWGPGRFESLYRAHAQPLETDPVRFERSTLFAHNDFLQAGATLGIPAVIFWFFGVGLFFALRPSGPWGRGTAAAVAAQSVVALFNFPLFLPINGLMMGGLLGLAPFSRRPRLGKSTTGALPVRAIAGVAFVVLALASGGAALGEAVGIPVPWDPRWVENRLSRADARLHPDPAEGRRPDPASARLLYEAVAEQFPERAEAWRGLAHLAAEHESPPRDADAVEAYARALRLWPLHVPWRVELAEVLERSGERRAARIEAHRALGLEPADGEAALLLGRLLRKEGDPAGADRWLSGWWNRWGTPPAPSEPGSPYRQAILRRDADSFLRERAIARMSAGRPRDALPLLSGLPPNEPERLLLEAGCWFYAGDLNRAEALLRTVQKTAPQRPETGPLLEKVRKRREGIR